MFSKNAYSAGFRFFLVVLPALFLLDVSVLRAQDAGDEIKALQKKRSMLLDEVVTISQRQYESGTLGIGELWKAQREALKAKLELAGNPKDRIAVLQQTLEHANKVVEILENLQKSGNVTQVQVLQAKAFVLESRINLLREEQKIKAVNKKNN